MKTVQKYFFIMRVFLSRFWKIGMNVTIQDIQNADHRPACFAGYSLLRSACLRFHGRSAHSQMPMQPYASKLAPVCLCILLLF